MVNRRYACRGLGAPPPDVFGWTEAFVPSVARPATRALAVETTNGNDILKAVLDEVQHAISNQPKTNRWV